MTYALRQFLQLANALTWILAVFQQFLLAVQSEYRDFHCGRNIFSLLLLTLSKSGWLNVLSTLTVTVFCIFVRDDNAFSNFSF